LDHGLQVLKPLPFQPNRCSKNVGETSIALWITACELRIPTSRYPNQNRAALCRIFLSNKSAPANRKSRFYAKVAQNFEVFSNIQELN